MTAGPQATRVVMRRRATRVALALGFLACARKPHEPPRVSHPDARSVDAEAAAILASPAKDGRCGYVDRTGTLVIPRRFEEAHEFSSGLAAVRSNGRVGFVDRAGAFAIAPSFDAAKDFHEGLAAACVKGRGWGFIDTHAAWIVPPAFAVADAFSEGVAVVRADTPLDGACRDDAAMGLAAGSECERPLDIDQEEPGHYYLIDRAGNRLNGKGYHCITPMSEGRAAARWQHKWGYLDGKGKEVLRPVFAHAKPFGEGWAAVWLPDRHSEELDVGKWAFIDREGRFKVLARYEASEVGVYSQGLVAMEGMPLRTLFANPVGRACLERLGHTAEEVRDNPKAPADCGAYLDKSGKIHLAVPTCLFDDAVAGRRSLHAFVGDHAELIMPEPMSTEPFRCAPALVRDARLFVNRQGQFVSPVVVLATRTPEGLAASCLRARPRRSADETVSE